MDIPALLQKSIESLSLTDPPGWITAEIPAFDAISTESENGKNASVFFDG